ncbi:MAG: phosphoribosylamine--glycine ligase [Alphaproteobacteria bacterium]|nr:phosphoribosylamine--glycine ligase [Alphaproteobacteria bacterium]
MYCKELCRRHGIPTAPFRVFADATRARAYVRERGVPLVIKADGLVAGKGVVVAASEDEAVAAIKAMFGGQFGAAGQRVIVEDCLIGEEVSFIALVDGRHCLPLAAAQDHKRVGEGDRGPNTGGMGAYSPAQALTPALQGAVMDRIMRPAVAALAAAGRPFVGALYAGLMLTADGPQVLEFNARFGDPECQVILPRLRSDILPALIGASDGMLASVDLRWRSDAALCVVLASRGYPGNHARGEAIRNLAAAEALPDVLVFHAGTARREGRLVAEGGRVLGVTALAPTLRLAQRQAYAAVDLIDWPGGFCRRDIGWRALAVPER